MIERWVCPVEHDRTRPVVISSALQVTGRWSRLDRRVRSVAAEGTRFGLRPDAGTKCDRTLAGCVRSVLTYVDVGRTEETLSDRTLSESGRA